MRDGTTTNRIPDQPTQCQDYNCDTDVEYGRHESWESYQYCKATSRNKGLFTANQNMNNRNSAKYTRQDNDGTRYGYECPEERDYYPYWRSSMWRDMAIYTNTVDRCPAYQRESLNVKDRWECKFTDKYFEDVLYKYVPNSNGELPLNEEDCVNSESIWYIHPESGETLKKYEWVKISAWGLDAPECTQTRTTRTNHHGTPGDRSYWTHYWKVPEEILDIDGHEQCCVIRARYNITTDDYQAWEADDSIGAGLNYMNNSMKNNPDPDDDPAWVKIWEDFGLTYEDIRYSFEPENNVDNNDATQKKSRGYVFRNDPEVDPFGYEPMGGSSEDEASRILLQLAINTDQFGRTFQDRTHCFSVKERTDITNYNRGRDADSDITLVTVQGKRGNIVQVYPATEYFFIPEPANIPAGSYVHFCWTGSNRNPNNNDGQGLQGSDRSNICPLTQQQWDKYDSDDALGDYGDVDGYWTKREGGAVGDPGNNYPDWIVEPSYGMPVYYNYAPKRDLPRVRKAFQSSRSAEKDFDLDEIPYNDPYNKFWFSERGAVSQMAGLDTDVLGALCTTRRVDALYDEKYGLFDYGNMEEFDDAGTTFCIEPIRVTETGEWNFLCTRNNNFSNRSQKGSLTVTNSRTEYVSATVTGYYGDALEGQAKIVILPKYVKEGDSLDFQVTTWLNRGEESTIVQLSGSDGGEFAADALEDDGWIEVWIPYTGKSLSKPTAWYRATADDSWSEHSQASIEYEAGTSYGVIQVTDGGFYTITNEIDVLAIIACILGIGIFGTAMFFVIKKNCMKK
eukprot:CAMPEP_0201573264 /NCGR_PEP_ID=MMETSP0190_2-20130828/17002_1 /ASSEMBLY_ACC=CAM_ASM_000263 /TAXON_ID=37353 /ORGANISM="Rosalina sp." /LENGTH=791 /DNA_ID=CAMNT_0048000001 /DNA_START=340 /DNA_END=2715 /DNA_ORIENTATION=-